MNYTVVWRQRAEVQLARQWIRAANKDASSGYVEQVERILARNPKEQGESREENYRVWVYRPLLVFFHVDEPTRTVRVGAVKWVGR
jgi:hypothetical protein